MRSTSTTSTRTYTVKPSTSASETDQPVTRSPHWQPTSLKMAGFFIIVLLLICGFLVVQYETARHKLAAASNTSATNQQTEELVAKVAKVAVLPNNETPTVASVVNVSQLRSQKFFTQAQNGDKVLIYNKAREAILYRPSSGQVVTMAPISSNANGTTTLGNQ